MNKKTTFFKKLFLLACTGFFGNISVAKTKKIQKNTFLSNTKKICIGSLAAVFGTSLVIFGLTKIFKKQQGSTPPTTEEKNTSSESTQKDTVYPVVNAHPKPTNFNSSQGSPIEPTPNPQPTTYPTFTFSPKPKIEEIKDVLANPDECRGISYYGQNHQSNNCSKFLRNLFETLDIDRMEGFGSETNKLHLSCTKTVLTEEKIDLYIDSNQPDEKLLIMIDSTASNVTKEKIQELFKDIRVEEKSFSEVYSQDQLEDNTSNYMIKLNDKKLKNKKLIAFRLPTTYFDSKK